MIDATLQGIGSCRSDLLSLYMTSSSVGHGCALVNALAAWNCRILLYDEVYALTEYRDKTDSLNDDDISFQT